MGEAFDKTAKLLGLPYPGGPELARLAETGTPGRYRLPRPMTDRPGLDFSFSGLKTAVLTALPKDADAQTRADLARGFEEAVTETLAIKCTRALDATGHARLVVAGGVGANLRLRARLSDLLAQRGGRAYFPPPRVLHRQRGDDRARRLAAPRRGAAATRTRASRPARAGRWRSCGRRVATPSVGSRQASAFG